MKKLGFLILTAAWLAVLTTPVAAQSFGPTHEGFDPSAPTDGHVHEGELGEKSLYLEHRLRCNCSCGLDVHQCQFAMQCGTSPVWSKRIRDELAAGRGVETIEAGFVADFGTTVLMAPPPEGFNLLGYFMPAVALVLAGVLAGLVARGGARSGELAATGPVTAEDEARLRAAMKELDEAESPDW